MSSPASEVAVGREQAGVVLESAGGVYRVLLDEGDEVRAFLRGRLKREVRTGGRVVAGDRVRLAPAGESEWTIDAVEDRWSELVRAGPGGHRPKVVAANLDQVIAVLSAIDPPFRPEIANRFLVLAESCGLAPILVVNKVDLDGAARELERPLEIFRDTGYPVLLTSAQTGRGLAQLRQAMAERISALIGPSGVGKSSLVNAVEPGLDLRVGEVGRRSGLGRHTTVAARLLELGGGARVVDTPGFSDVAAWGIPARELSRAFPEFEPLAARCRFRGCSHLHEPDCAVREAVEEGAVHPARYAMYRDLMEEQGT